MDKILFTVSISVSPFLTEDWAAEKLITSAESLFWASSKDNLVRVLFSKNILAMVISLSEGTFLIERLVPTFIDLKGFNSLAYQYTADTVADKYQPYFSDISALSDLKVLINQYESDELYTIWNHYRHKFLAENPGILNLE